MKELLGKEFILISNFCIISKRHIRGVDATNRTVSLTNGYECGISKRHASMIGVFGTTAVASGLTAVVSAWKRRKKK